jgi:hypothetical protein
MHMKKFLFSTLPLFTLAGVNGWAQQTKAHGSPPATTNNSRETIHMANEEAYGAAPTEALREKFFESQTTLKLLEFDRENFLKQASSEKGPLKGKDKKELAALKKKYLGRLEALKLTADRLPDGVYKTDLLKRIQIQASLAFYSNVTGADSAIELINESEMGKLGIEKLTMENVSPTVMHYLEFKRPYLRMDPNTHGVVIDDGRDAPPPGKDASKEEQFRATLKVMHNAEGDFADQQIRAWVLQKY